MKKFRTPYEFYKLPEAERIAMVNSYFSTEDEPVARYFPISLTENGANWNYGRHQGLLYLSPIWLLKKQNPWFKVAAFSPDDLDLCLYWEGNNATPAFREKILSWIEEMPKDNIDYQEALEFIQSYFQGTIGL